MNEHERESARVLLYMGLVGVLAGGAMLKAWSTITRGPELRERDELARKLRDVDGELERDERERAADLLDELYT